MSIIAMRLIPETSTLHFLDFIVQLDELFAHLVFWPVAIAALDLLRVPTFRVAGAACVLYSFVSMIWVGMMNSTIMLNGAIFLLVAYLFVAVAMKENRSTSKYENKVLAQKDEGISTPVVDGINAKAEQPVEVKTLTVMLEIRCDELADEHGLSPREREVFNFLAQNRTRTYIQDELFLSGNTVKTHVTYVYKKFNVCDHQEMMDVVLDCEQ